MVENVVNIYIDESGTPDLEIPKKGNDPYFVYAAVVIKERDVEKAREIHKKVCSKYHKAGYIKSNHIPNDDNGFLKTISTLTELDALDHIVFVLVIDKSKISEGGLSYKQSFIKYFQRLLSAKLLKDYDEVHVFFDKTGYKDFQDSLDSYMKKHLLDGPTLFSNNTFEVKDDISEEQLIQLADFYAGTIGKYYCGRYNQNHANIIHNTFLRKRLSITWFPSEYISFIAASVSFDNAFNPDLTQIAIDSANNYLKNYQEDISGCELIRYVLQESMRNPLRHISSKEIKVYLKNHNIEIGDPIVKISELRDKGVLIISPLGKKGYKFPNNEREVADFFNRLSTNIVPQLKRGSLFNTLLHEKSCGRLNVMAKPEFRVLLSLCEMVNGNTIERVHEPTSPTKAQ